jgi:hypothetical protein
VGMRLPADWMQSDGSDLRMHNGPTRLALRGGYG